MTPIFITAFFVVFCCRHPRAFLSGSRRDARGEQRPQQIRQPNTAHDKIRKRISHYFGLQPIVLESWITSLTLLRNASCHHSRVWNKVSSIMPVTPRRIAHPRITLPTNPQRVYFTICIIKYFLDIISPNNDMLDKMNRLFATFPEIVKSALVFPSGWKNEPLWQ